MDTEANPNIFALNFHKSTHSFAPLPMQAYAWKYHNVDVLLILNGRDPVHSVRNIGTQAATLSTYVGFNYFHPDLIISVGTAGGIEANGVKLREIYAGSKIYFFDRRIPIEGYQQYGLGEYQSFVLPAPERNIGLKSGVVCSGDSFDDDQTDYHAFTKLHCDAVDMEAAGVAWVSMLTKTSMLAIKGITNLVKGSDTHAQYQANLPVVTAKLAKTLQELLIKY